jgi:hypothetical protein
MIGHPSPVDAYVCVRCGSYVPQAGSLPAVTCATCLGRMAPMPICCGEAVLPTVNKCTTCGCTGFYPLSRRGRTHGLEIPEMAPYTARIKRLSILFSIILAASIAQIALMVVWDTWPRWPVVPMVVLLLHSMAILFVRYAFPEPIIILGLRLRRLYAKQGLCDPLKAEYTELDVQIRQLIQEISLYRSRRSGSLRVE